MMKKVLFLSVALFSIGKLAALPVDNPAQASFFAENIPQLVVPSKEPSFAGHGWRLGYYGDFVFNRHLKTVRGKHIDYTHMQTNAAYLAINCWQVFELFTTLGASKFALNTSLAAFNPNNRGPRFDFETSTTFSWSVGGRATIWSYKNLTIGAVGQYFRSRPHTHIWYIRENISGNSHDDFSRYTEWQIAAGAAYNYNTWFIPYAALKWTRVIWEFDDQPLRIRPAAEPVATLINLRNGTNWGYAIGLSFVRPFECKNLTVTVEGRFGDESALHINAFLFF